MFITTTGINTQWKFKLLLFVTTQVAISKKLKISITSYPPHFEYFNSLSIGICNLIKTKSKVQITTV